MKEHNSIAQVIEGAKAQGRQVLSEIETKRILEALGIPTALAEAAESAEQAVRLAERVGFPVALKVISPEVSHKTEVDGVALGLNSGGAVRAAFERIRDSLARKLSGARFEGVAVQAMAPPGVELLAGITRDAQFGPLVVVGLGGVLVEVLGDTAVRLAPVDAAEARAMLGELRGAVLLEGSRGRQPVDRRALALLLVKLSELALRYPELKELDLNPVAAYPQGLRVLDARALLEAAPEAAAHAGDAARAASAERRGRRLENLARALRPAGVAVIGDRGTRQYMWLRALDRFTGARYSVQPDARERAGIEALGIKNFASIGEIPGPVDYALAAVPRQAAPQVLRECVAKGVAGIAFFTAGFSETGEELGARLEAELRAIALGSEIALVGPNCMGLCNPSLGLLNWPRLKPGAAGDVSFISQSGTHAIGFCMHAPWHGIKANTVASIGNATVLEVADYLDVMADDPATRVIGLYVEGVGDGRRFFASLKRAARRIPVLVWKGGATDSGARATFSHTASLATSGAVWRAAMRQSGAVEVTSLEALLDAVELLTRARPLAGRRIGLLGMTGGQSVVLCDTFARNGLEVPELSASSHAELARFFTTIGGSYRNPLDAAWTVLDPAGRNNLDRMLDILDGDPALDALVMEVRPGMGLAAIDPAATEQEMVPVLDKLARFNERARKPLAVVVQGGHVPGDEAARLVAGLQAMARGRGLVAFDGFERAAAAFRTVVERQEAGARLGEADSAA